MVTNKKNSNVLVCSKHFPKKFADEITFTNNGYRIYRGRRYGITIKRIHRTGQKMGFF